MGLIIKKIQMLMKGYPTISDKYDVAPAVLEGSGEVGFGAPVMFGSTTGRYKAFAAATGVGQLAGFVLATNVKAPAVYPATETPAVKPGEAFNLLVRGGIAVELDAALTTVANVKEGAELVIKLADGALGSDATEGVAVVIPGVEFTGIIENKGTAEAPVWIAEVIVKQGL